MRVVVFGGRNYDDRRTLYRTLDAVHARRRITCIKCRGFELGTLS
jgi:Protein of unknown function (DUF2493).